MLKWVRRLIIRFNRYRNWLKNTQYLYHLSYVFDPIPDTCLCSVSNYYCYTHTHTRCFILCIIHAMIISVFTSIRNRVKHHVSYWLRVCVSDLVHTLVHECIRAKYSYCECVRLASAFNERVECHESFRVMTREFVLWVCDMRDVCVCFSFSPTFSILLRDHRGAAFYCALATHFIHNFLFRWCFPNVVAFSIDIWLAISTLFYYRGHTYGGMLVYSSSSPRSTSFFLNEYSCEQCY